MTENEMAEWHHQLNGHEFQQALGDGEGQGRLACCSPWGRKESDMTECLNINNIQSYYHLLYCFVFVGFFFLHFLSRKLES